MSTRKFATVVNIVIILVSVAAGVIAGLTVAGNAGSAAPKAPQLKTADYNDGWVDGQLDVQDELGHRLPNATEYATWVAQDKPNGRCHLEWDGPAIQAYEVVCAR